LYFTYKKSVLLLLIFFIIPYNLKEYNFVEKDLCQFFVISFNLNFIKKH